MTAAELWLRAHDDGVPGALLDQMLRALPAGDGPVAEALAQGAISLYADVGRGPGDRGAALPLLAADALFTHAFQAQAEADPDGLERLVQLCEERLGEVVP